MRKRRCYRAAPHRKPTPDLGESVKPSYAPSSPTPALDALRRQREASLRCTPLADGRRNPWEGQPWPSAPVKVRRAPWLHMAQRLSNENTDRLLRGAA